MYRGRLQHHDQGGPEGRLATVVVAARDEIEALQLHGCFGTVVGANWKDVARPRVEDWRPGEEEDDDDDENIVTQEENADCEKETVEEAECWTVLKERDDAPVGLLPPELHLELCEAFFLAYGLGCLTVKGRGGNETGLLEMWKLFCGIEEDFPQRYRVYHHFRTEGWVVRSGYKFGADWLLYKLSPALYHSTYMVRVEGVNRETGETLKDIEALTWRDVLGKSRVAAAVKKDLLIARVTHWADKRDWDGPHCLHSMAVSTLVVRRWVPGEERWSVKPEVPKETPLVQREGRTGGSDLRKTTFSASSSTSAVTESGSRDIDETVIVLD